VAAGRPDRAATGAVSVGPVSDGPVSTAAMSAAAGPLRVLVADDQKVVRDGLSLLLGLLPGIEVTGTAVDGADAVRQAAALAPDVVLMDLSMPNSDGVEATRAIVQRQPQIRVVVLTAYSDDDSVFAALRAGARGFLTKNASSGEILRALSAVRAGDAQLDPSVQRRLVEAVLSGEPPGTAGSQAGQAAEAGEAGGPDPAPDGLTPRELEVLAAIAAGLSNAELAGKFRISGATVKSHINHMLAKTGARDRGQLVGYAFRHGIAD
jgi:DNA-binding NarL/FixJ family response regulator